MAIYKRKNKNGSVSFQVKVRDPEGKWYPTPCFPTEDEAEEEEKRLEKLKKKGGLTLSKDAKTNTVKEFFAVWGVDRRGAVSEGWVKSQDQMFRDYVDPVIGDKVLSEIDKPEIGRVLAYVAKRGRGKQMQKHVYSLLRVMFGDAVEYYEMLATNPVSPKFHRPKVPQQERDFLKPADAWRLLEAAKAHAYMGPPVWVQTLAAMRPEAVQGLMWDAVQWDLDQILIKRAYKKKVGKLENYPKNKDWSYVPMIPALKAYLWELWSGLKQKDVLEFVCQGPRGGMLSYDTYHATLARLCRSTKVTVLTPHELRHTSTEIWVEAGASHEDLRRLLNHASAASTARYIHRTDERLQSLASKIVTPCVTTMFPHKFPHGNKEPVRHPDEEGPRVH